MSTTQANEIEITLTSDQLANDTFIKQTLVETKMKILAEICEAAECDLNQKVRDLCPEVKDYPNLISRYNITLPKTTSSKSSLKLKKKKTLSKKTNKSPPTPDPKPETTGESEPTPEPKLETTGESPPTPEPKPDTTSESPPKPNPKPETTNESPPTPEPKPEKKKKKVLKRKSDKLKVDS